MTKQNFTQKSNGDTLSASEWNQLTAYVNTAVDEINAGSGSTSGGVIDTSGMISVSAKGNTEISSAKNINLEAAYGSGVQGDIALKPGDDIQFCSHHREAKKRDKVVVKNIDNSDNPVKLDVVAGEINLAVGTKNNPKTATRKKDNTTGEDIANTPLFKADDAKTLDVTVLTGTILDEGGNDERDERGYLKVRAQAIDLRCEKHGGIALQPKGYDNSGNMNKIKFEHGGGDGLEFGTFNTEKSSLYTDEYRFKKDGIWKMATRTTEPSGKTIRDEGTIPTGKTATGSLKYVKQADDFYDIIDISDEQCTTKDIIKTCYALNGNPVIHTKVTNNGNLEIATKDKFLVEIIGYMDEVTQISGDSDLISGSVMPYREGGSGLENGKYYDVDEISTAFDINEPSYIEDPLNALTDGGYGYIGESVVPSGYTTADTKIYKITKHSATNINIESGAGLKLKGILDFGSTFNFGETDNGIEFQHKLTKKNVTKDCGIIKVVAVNNHPSNNLTVNGWDSTNNAVMQYTITPGNTETVASCSILDVILLVNYMKTNNQGPWANA